MTTKYLSIAFLLLFASCAKPTYQVKVEEIVKGEVVNTWEGISTESTVHNVHHTLFDDKIYFEIDGMQMQKVSPKGHFNVSIAEIK